MTIVRGNAGIFRWSLWLGALLSLVAFGAIRSAAAQNPNRGGETLVEEVKRAIEKAVQYLKDQEQGKGNWEVDGMVGLQAGGESALAMLALLNAGVKPEEPIIQRGLAEQRKIVPAGTYAVGLQTMVFVQAGQPQDRPLIQRNVEWLVRSHVPRRGTRAGGWGYGTEAGVPDGSNSQYALLGIHEGLKAGAVVPERILREYQADILGGQDAIGGWGYRDGSATTFTMTTAGLCNLIITGMDLMKGKQKLRPDGSADDCGIYDENQSLQKAINWVGTSFPARISPAQAKGFFHNPYYALYGIERAGRLTGQRYFGGHDWYRVGCDFLVKTQNIANGSWDRELGPQDTSPLVATSFALLYLAKGRTPVLISKFAHNSERSWNRKRNDMRNLVEFTSRQVFEGMPLAWQVFDTKLVPLENGDEIRKTAGELLQSPIVWFNGHEQVPRGAQRELLKEYVNNGGFIMAEACCGSVQFDAEFRLLVKQMFPDNELIRLPENHPIWTASGKFLVNPGEFSLYGISQGCKTVLVYSDKPISGYWEENRFTEGRGRDAFRLGANIIAYATGLEAPKPRLTVAEVFQPEARTAVRRGFLKVGQIKYGSDWQPAPRAMRSLMDQARKAGLDVDLQPKPVSIVDPNLADFRFLYLHGRASFSFAKSDLAQLKWVLQNGGTLLSDACCGAKPFDDSFRKFVDDLFADEAGLGKPKLEVIPPGDLLYSAELNGKPIDKVRLRREPQAGQPADAEYKLGAPRLEGVKVNGRWAIIYSRHDIGCALEKNKSTDCIGYDYDGAVQLARAALFYALIR